VRADDPQLAPLVDIDKLHGKELAGSRRLGSRCDKTVAAHAVGVSRTALSRPNGLLVYQTPHVAVRQPKVRQSSPACEGRRKRMWRGHWPNPPSGG
jgi:hypothetical protein